jgi:hypothetical protein
MNIAIYYINISELSHLVLNMTAAQLVHYVRTIQRLRRVA